MDTEIYDEFKYLLVCSLWNEQIELLNNVKIDNSIIAFNGIRLIEYSGRSAGTLKSTTISIDPKITREEELRMFADELNNCIEYKYFFNQNEIEETDLLVITITFFV